MRKKILILICGLFAAVATYAQDVAVFPQLGSEGVNSIAFSPDGKYVLSGSDDSTVKLWDVASGREIRTFSGHTNRVYSVAFSPDGKQIISGGGYGDNTIKLWDVASGWEIRTFSGHNEAVESVAFSPNGKYILSGSEDKTIKLWDAATGREIKTFIGHKDHVNSVAFSPDGKQILSGSGSYDDSDNTVRLWDIASGREIKTFSGHTEYITSVAFSPDGKQVLSGSWDSMVKLWNISSGQELRTFSENEDSVVSVAFSPDGKQVLSGSFGHTIKLWDVASGRKIKTFSDGGVSIFSPNGKQILSISGNNLSSNIIKLWDIASGSVIRTFSGHSDDVNDIVFNPNGKQVLSSSGNPLDEEGTIKLWDISSGKIIRTFSEHLYGSYVVAFSPDGKQILSGSRDNTVKLWEIASGREIRAFSGHSYGVNSVAFSPDGKQALSGSDDTTVKLWDVASGKEIRTFSGHSYDVISVAFSPDGKQALSGSLDKTVKLWDVASGKEIRTFSGHTNQVNSVVFSPDGKQILSGSGSGNYESTDNTVKLWDAASGKEIRTFSGHTNWVTSVAFSPDGKQALSSSFDKTVKLWNVSNGQEIRTFKGHNSYVRSVAFSPNGKQILSCSEDGTIRLWDVASGAEIAQFISFDDGEWVCITPEGYYNASPQGDKYLNVRIGNNVYGIDQYRETFFNSTIVAIALSGDRNAYFAAVKQRGKTLKDAGSAPPLVAITSPATGATANSAATKISVSVNGGSRSIEYITVKVNGKMVARDYGVTPTGAKSLTTMARLAVLADKNVNKKQASFNLDIPLEPGNNIIEVIAYNGYGEGRAVTEVAYRTNQTNLPTLYILSIGVSKYADKSIESLKYAANDAKGIVQAFRAQEGKRYGSVKSLVLADGGDKEPTRDNISDGMDFLRGAGHNDVMMLFLSGHGGTDDQGNFFFMPTNMTFNANGAPQRSRIIPNSELQDVLRFPGQKIVFIDSCYSGGVNNDDLVNGLNLVRDGAPVIFTSSSKTEKSWEHDPAKLSLFTYVLLQGLSGSADADKDKKVTVQELGEYVKKAVPGIRDNQHPYYLAPDGYRDFVVAETK